MAQVYTELEICIQNIRIKLPIYFIYVFIVFILFYFILFYFILFYFWWKSGVLKVLYFETGKRENIFLCALVKDDT